MHTTKGGSSYSIVTRLRAERPWFSSRIGQWWRLLFAITSTSALGPPCFLSSGYRGVLTRE